MDMSLFEPITRENLDELSPGEWIWDSKKIVRRVHDYSLDLNDTVSEPIGFRQIHILDSKYFGQYSWTPFMLSVIDGRLGGGYTWTYFEENRFYKFKKNNLNEVAKEGD